MIRPSTWTEVTSLTTAAVVCASAAVGWLTYWSGRRDQMEERRRRQLEVIGNWAGTT